ncbi:MAG: hypothetical protein WKF83_14010 [Nocardioidaceae bacterium]
MTRDARIAELLRSETMVAPPGRRDRRGADLGQLTMVWVLRRAA